MESPVGGAASPKAPPNVLPGAPVLRQRVEAMLRRLGWSVAVNLESLPGDASTRRYYRAQPEAAGAPRFCLMQLPEPHHGGDAESAVWRELPYVNVQRFLASAGLPVPAIHAYDEPHGLLLIEDLGDTLLVDALGGAAPETIRMYYREAVGNLLCMQQPQPEPRRAACRAFHYEFGEETFVAELQFFAEHMLVNVRGADLDAADRNRLDAAFATLSRAALAMRHLFTHRDYHARNLMLHGGRLVIIDFQDARLGPALYDLASLLYDSYWVLDPELRQELLAEYRAGWGRIGRDEPWGDDFERRLRLCALQRNLKAIGTFASMQARKGTDAYLGYIPPTLDYARSHFDHLPEVDELRRLLARWLPEIG